MSDNKFGERLHALRTGAGISQERLAQRAGISVRALSDMERGRTRGPRQRTVEALVSALGVDGVVGRELEDAARSGRPRAVGGTGPRSSAGTGQARGWRLGTGWRCRAIFVTSPPAAPPWPGCGSWPSTSIPPDRRSP
nr:helix-turn-helix transcriptional regulator [Streptomyces poriferorum]